MVAAASRAGFVGRALVASLLQSCDSDGHVGLPSVGAPVRNRTCINRLSSGRTAIVLQERELVALRIEDDTRRLVLTGGLESPRFGLQNRCSPSELRQH